MSKMELISKHRRAAVASMALLFGLTAACSAKSSSGESNTPVRSGTTAGSQPEHRAGYHEITVAVVQRDLGKLAVKGRAPMTGYSRAQFGAGWATLNGCDTRDRILQRDLMGEQLKSDGCEVQTGTLHDPYTGKIIIFKRGTETSGAVQIDHTVALGNAWQTGAQQMTAARRKQLANDTSELLAVDGPSNEQKGDGDAATWLPPNKAERCDYVGTQVEEKSEFGLWVTPAEKDAITRVLATCAGQMLQLPY